MSDIRMMNWNRPEPGTAHQVCCPQCGSVMAIADYRTCGDDGHYVMTCPDHGELSIYKSQACTPDHQEVPDGEPAVSR